MSPTADARALLVEWLAPLEALDPPVRVIAHARKIDPPSVPTVLVRYDRQRPAGSAAGARRVRLFTFAVLCVPAKREGPPGEDESLELLDDVLAVLETTQATWEEAEQGTYEDTNHPAQAVTVTVPLKIGA